MAYLFHHSCIHVTIFTPSPLGGIPGHCSFLSAFGMDSKQSFLLLIQAELKINSYYFTHFQKIHQICIRQDALFVNS